jgi:hypothetical protein
MMPNVEQLVAAQNAINAQHPYLARIPAGETVDVTLTAEQLATIASALGVATNVALCNDEWSTTTPAQTAWAAIIDVALQARGAPGDALRSEGFAALTRVDAPTLERMAALVLCDAKHVGPDTPETAAEKARAARSALDGFREVTR